MPSLPKSSFGPMPESSSNLGLPTTPALNNEHTIHDADAVADDAKVKNGADDDTEYVNIYHDGAWNDSKLQPYDDFLPRPHSL